jgi:hypothetical protein
VAWVSKTYVLVVSNHKWNPNGHIERPLGQGIFQNRYSQMEHVSVALLYRMASYSALIGHAEGERRDESWLVFDAERMVYALV